LIKKKGWKTLKEIPKKWETLIKRGGCENPKNKKNP
jgi:hypothetical protein